LDGGGRVQSGKMLWWMIDCCVLSCSVHNLLRTEFYKRNIAEVYTACHCRLYNSIQTGDYKLP